MADEKTILRELSVIIGVGLAREKRGNKPSNPNEFIRLAEEFCKNIQEHNIELEKIKSIKNFENSQISIIKNGLTLGTYIYEKLKQSGEICWTGNNVRSMYPFDMTIDNIGFSLKEDSYILKNPAFSDYLNALVQPEKPFKNVHVFRHFAPEEFEYWFKYAYSELIEEISNLGNNCVVFSYKNKYFIKRVNNEIVFEENGNKKVSKSIKQEVSESEFNKDIPNKIIEHTFSKWIKENLEKIDCKYLRLKKICSEKAGCELKKYIESNFNPDKGKILEILQIYKNEYYFGKSLNKVPKLFKVPSKDKCDISSLTVNYKVPKSQLNVLFTFEVIISLNGSDKNSKIEMHVECRYSHGQFNGIPEAKLYCKDSLDKLYQELT